MKAAWQFAVSIWLSGGGLIRRAEPLAGSFALAAVSKLSPEEEKQ
jgi:hypothetical protein